MKVKASLVLTKALELIETQQQSFVCAAILDVEVAMRWDQNQEISSKAMPIWMTFVPKEIKSNQSIREWWPKGDVRRIETLKSAIATAKKRND